MATPDFEYPILDRMVVRERKRGGIRSLATELEKTVRSSRAFSWAGVVAKGVDPEGQTEMLVLHFLRQPNVTLSLETQISIELILHDIQEYYAKNSSTNFGYFLTDGPEYTPQDFKETLMGKYKKDSEDWTLIKEWTYGDRDS